MVTTPTTPLAAPPQTAKQVWTPEAYLDWEEQQPGKYAYVEGEVIEMTGGSIAHGTIAGNFHYILQGHLRGGPCRAFVFDVKVGVSAQGPYHYPDVMVSCDERDREARRVISYPCLIAEVLSPSTEGFDRGNRFAHYRRIETLREYLLISTDQVNVECFRLNAQGFWELHPYGAGDEVQLISLDLRFPVAQLYETVQLEGP